MACAVCGGTVLKSAQKLFSWCKMQQSCHTNAVHSSPVLDFFLSPVQNVVVIPFLGLDSLEVGGLLLLPIWICPHTLSSEEALLWMLFSSEGARNKIFFLLVYRLFNILPQKNQLGVGSSLWWPPFVELLAYGDAAVSFTDSVQTMALDTHVRTSICGKLANWMVLNCLIKCDFFKWCLRWYMDFIICSLF